jgi:hypothetical protein
MPGAICANDFCARLAGPAQLAELATDLDGMARDLQSAQTKAT